VTFQIHLAAAADVDQPSEVAGFRAARHSEGNNNDQQDV
jgi:hypothetical protein